MFISLQPSLKASMSSLTLKTHGNPRFKKINLFPYPCHVAMKKIITMSQKSNNNNNNNYESIRAEIEAHLKQAIPLKPPLCVYEPMSHLTLTAPPPDPGPALCVAAFDLVGGGGGGCRSQAVAAAAALHLLNASTLAHENLPLTDRPTANNSNAHHIYEPNIELLLPDAMVPFGFELLAASDDPDDGVGSGRVLRVMVEITRMGGSQGIIDALYRERVNGGGGELEWIDDTCRRKEGALHACAGACGAILGGANEEEVENLRNYGLYVGMIQGYSNRIGTKKEVSERVLELRNLALKELEHFKFKGRDIEAISTFVIGP